MSTALADLTFSRKRIALDVKKTLEVGGRQCREQSRSRRRLAGRRRGACRQCADAEALDAAGPWPRRPHPQAVLASDHRRPRSRGVRLMGQKVNPIGLRLGINRTWDSRWFANKGEYGRLLHEDMKIRNALMKDLKQAAVSKIVIERPHKKCRVTIHSARPGIVIGKKGADIEKLRKMVAAHDRLRGPHQYRRGAQARDRRLPRRRFDRPAARAPRCVPPRHEARRAVGDAAWRRGHPHHLRRPSRRRRDRADGVVPRGPRAAAYAARRRRLRRRHGEHRLRHLRHQGLDLQGRDHGARSDGVRAPSDRRRRSGPVVRRVAATRLLKD